MSRCLVLYSVELFGICSVAAVVSCGSILSSEGHCSTLIEVLLPFTLEGLRLHHPPLPPDFLLSVYSLQRFASYCEYCIPSRIMFSTYAKHEKSMITETGFS